MRLIIYSKDDDYANFLVRRLNKIKISSSYFSVRENLIDDLKNKPCDILIIFSDYFNDLKDLVKKIRSVNDKVYILVSDILLYHNIRVEALKYGVDDYIDRNTTVEEMEYKVRAISKVILRYSENRVNIFEYEDLILDSEKRLVTVKGKEVILSNREFLILEFFLKNKGRLLTRNVIYEKFWEIKNISNTNIIDVYISNIRKKTKKNIISSIRGAGYILK